MHQVTSVMMGLIFNIQRYSTQDGRGIRTVVFFKGCPLSCWWCANPESQRLRPELAWVTSLCHASQRCVSVCSTGAISAEDPKIKLRRAACTFCGECVQACPSGALKIIGSYMTLAQVRCEIRKDLAFYRRSHGGVTLSGGEVLSQHAFAAAVLAQCRHDGINTAIETCGHSSWRNLAAVARNADTVYYDLKIADRNDHQEFCGTDNRLIFENARRLAREAMDVVFRIPIIPGITDSEENVRAIARFVKAEAGARPLELLPYHALGSGKYAWLDRVNRLGSARPPTAEEIEALRRIAMEECVNVSVQDM
ncbi:MAG: glycyl-radical enzyme activating protein [Alphaproteobacteria bacterium]